MKAKTKITLYHATNKANIFSIIALGLLPGMDGHIYFCKNQDDALTYAYMYDRTPREVAVIPIKFTEEEFNNMELNADNAPGITPDAYSYAGEISKKRIPALWKIKLYEIS